MLRWVSRALLLSFRPSPAEPEATVPAATGPLASAQAPSPPPHLLLTTSGPRMSEEEQYVAATPDSGRSHGGAAWVLSRAGCPSFSPRREAVRARPVNAHLSSRPGPSLSPTRQGPSETPPCYVLCLMLRLPPFPPNTHQSHWAPQARGGLDPNLASVTGSLSERFLGLRFSGSWQSHLAEIREGWRQRTQGARHRVAAGQVKDGSAVPNRS